MLNVTFVSVCGDGCVFSVCGCVFNVGSAVKLFILVFKSEECEKIEVENRKGFLLKIVEIFTFIYKDLI